MDSLLKKKLRALSLALRHTLEGSDRQPGDLENRLNQMGVWKDRPAKPIEELRLLPHDLRARRIVNAFLKYRDESGVSQNDAFCEFVRESAYSWANRLFMLRCLESRDLIDEVILQKQVYGGRSLVHHRFAQQNPSACTSEDDGLFAVFNEEFRRRAVELPTVFDPEAPAIILRPSVSALKLCVGLLSGTVSLNGHGQATDDLFQASDAPGWAYQYWNAEEKDRVFERLRTEKGAKIEGADLIPATQLYTEPYMVKFLVQNSLGALWASMYPETELPEQWEYYVRDADRAAPVKADSPPFDPARPPKPSADPWIRPNPKLDAEREIVAYARTLTAKVSDAEASQFVGLRNRLLDEATRPIQATLVSLYREICEAWNREWPDRRPKLRKQAAELTFLDPACGSGHFLMEAFDLLYVMYEEEGVLRTSEEICAAILNYNLFGIDIDERAIQISAAALWMHALDHAPNLKSEAVTGLGDHIIAANLSLPRGLAHLDEFLAKHPDDADLRSALEAVFRGLADASQLGTLLQIEKPVEQELQRRKEAEDQRAQIALKQSQAKLEFVPEQYVLSQRGIRDYNVWKRELLERLKVHFRKEAALNDPVQAFFGHNAEQGLAVFELLSRRYDVVAGNPPYLGHGKAGRTVAVGLLGYKGGTDLYGAFIERAIELSSEYGIVGILSLANYLHSDDFLPLREWLLSVCQIQSIVNLGNKSFEDLSNPNATYFCMAIFCNARVAEGSVRTFDLDGLEYGEKAEVLLQCLHSQAHLDRSFSPAQASFTLLPGMPFAFKLPGWARAAYDGRCFIKDVADCRQGLITGDTDRFLRHRWESPKTGRWIRYAKGGPYRRWFGNDEWALDWQGNGARIRHFTDSEGSLRSRPQNLQYFRRDGCSWSSQTISAFAVRRLEPESGFDTTGSSAFPNDESTTTEQLLAVFNTPAFGEIFSAIQPGVHFGEGYLQNLPFPRALNELDLREDVESCTSLQKALLRFELTSEQFSLSGLLESRATSFLHMCIENAAARLQIQLQLHEIECRIWDQVEAILGVPDHSRTTQRRYKPTTTPNLEDLIGAWLTAVSTARPQSVAASWRATQNKVEESLVNLRCHPSALTGLIRDSRERLDTHIKTIDLAETASAALDFISALVLRVFGHYPCFSRDNSTLGTVHSKDGIIVIGGAPTQPPLMRIISDEFSEQANIGSSLQAEFEKLTGTQLGRWLERQFFARHTSQFLTRPVVWQIQPVGLGKGLVPVFSCLVYYHRIVGALANLRTNYAGTLRASFESEMRTLESLTQKTADQSARRETLGFWIDELKQFQATLEDVEARGFATSQLRRYAIDDATHSLARRWLGRLRDVLKNEQLLGWQKKAEAENLHSDFSAWIAVAVEHVDRQCVAVAPEPPSADNHDETLTSAELVRLFHGQAPSMIRTALEAICREWRAQFDKALLQPLREQIKTAEEEYKQLEDNIENKLFRKDLKLRVRALKNEIAGLSAKSGSLATVICDWRYPEANAWGDWLATQPLYDEYSSLDGRRPVPTTVAEFVSQENQYAPDINDGVRVNIAPLQKARILARDVLAAKDMDKAIADRAEWRAEERRWCRQGVLPRPGWWFETNPNPKQTATIEELIQ